MTAERGRDGVLFDCAAGCLFLPWSVPITADEVVKRLPQAMLYPLFDSQAMIESHRGIGVSNRKAPLTRDLGERNGCHPAN